jgi:hypothetical protein
MTYYAVRYTTRKWSLEHFYDSLNEALGDVADIIRERIEDDIHVRIDVGKYPGQAFGRKQGD